MKEGLIALWLGVTFELFRQNIIFSGFLAKTELTAWITHYQSPIMVKAREVL